MRQIKHDDPLQTERSAFWEAFSEISYYLGYLTSMAILVYIVWRNT